MFHKNPSAVFTETPAYRSIKSFVEGINARILGTVAGPDQPAHRTDAAEPSSDVERRGEYPAVFVREDCILPVLRDIRAIVGDTPAGSPGRYASLGMVDVLKKIQAKFCEGPDPRGGQSNNRSAPANDESPPFNHLVESFGNGIRMDYGTGHELNFICYLYTQVHNTANANGELSISDSQLLFLLANIDEYLKIIRVFLQKFNVEPAGARGCWAVSDYSLVGHLFGSAIDCIKEAMAASHTHHPGHKDHLLAALIVDTFGDMLKETVGSNPNVMLIKILNLPKALQNRGFRTMYDKEVFRRSVVTQHFIYCDCLSD